MSPPGRLLPALLVLLLAVPAVQSFPFLDDPGVVSALKVIDDILRAIHQVELLTHLALQKGIRGTIRDVGFPGELFETVDRTLSEVGSLRQEMEGLACGWRFSPRTDLLRSLYLRRLTLCRADFHRLWGSSSGQWDADLQELQDYTGTLSANLISGRAEAEGSWLRSLPRLEKDAALLRKSPGEANRDEAVSLAGAGVVASSNSALLSQTLLVQQLERAQELREDRTELEMGRFLLLAASGVDPWSAASSEGGP